MERYEIIEWALIILVIIGWWPWIFLGYHATWYYVLTHFASPILLAVILWRRYRRVQEGFEYSRRIVDAQQQATGANVLGRQQHETGADGGDEAEDGRDAQQPPDVPSIPGISGKRPDDDQ